MSHESGYERENRTPQNDDSDNNPLLMGIGAFLFITGNSMWAKDPTAASIMVPIGSFLFITNLQ